MTTEKAILTSKTVLVRRSELPAAQLGETVVAIMNARRDHYYGLEHVASRIWELLEQPKTVPEICDCLTAEYEIDEGQCRLETLAFLQDALQEELIAVEPQ